MAKGSGWSILGRKPDPPGVPVPPVPLVPPAPPALPVAPAYEPPTPPTPGDRRADARAAQARLPQYYTTTDLVEVFGGKDALLDAYVEGWLTPLATQTLESNYPQLQCWLLARLIRLTRQPETR